MFVFKIKLDTIHLADFYGPGRLSHQEEWSNIIKNTQEAGVEVRILDGDIYGVCSQRISDDKLVECLDIHHNQVLLNTMSQIAQKKLCNEEIIEKLKQYENRLCPKKGTPSW